MLREIKNVRQDKAERMSRSSFGRETGRRRWFESDDLEVVVWLDRAFAVRGFQLIYDAGAGEHALTWREGIGFEHTRVDSGDENRPFKATPVLVPEGAVPWPEIIRRFDANSATLEPELRQFIAQRLAR